MSLAGLIRYDWWQNYGRLIDRQHLTESDPRALPDRACRLRHYRAADQIDFLRISRAALADAEITIKELYRWEFNGPFLKDL